jgi:uncharacterized membrane protein
MREWHNARLASAVTRAANDAEKRLLESQNRRQRRWMVAAASACLIVIMALTADFIYAKANSAEARVSALTVQGANVRVPISSVNDGDMHLFSADVGGGKIVRFMIIKKPTGWGTALDACRICGAEGYRQDGQNVVCRHCGSAIYVPTIGEAGGCNPIGVPSRVDGTDLVLDISALSQATHEIPN